MYAGTFLLLLLRPVRLLFDATVLALTLRLEASCFIANRVFTFLIRILFIVLMRPHGFVIIITHPMAYLALLLVKLLSHENLSAFLADEGTYLSCLIFIDL